jgi:glucose/arabinose dehydrogenase
MIARVRYDTRMRCAAAACAFLLLPAGRAEAQLQGQVYVASGLQSPLAFVQDPTDRTVQFVVQQTGRIRVVRNGAVLATDFLDLTGIVRSGGERGLLGLAFAPNYASSRVRAQLRVERTLLRQLHEPGR